jgi:hypothetical protein
MRVLGTLLFLVAAGPALAQPAAPAAATLEAMRRDFPLDYQPLAASLAGKPAQEARRLAYAGIDRFLRSRRAAILAAPGPDLIAIEARQGALLRSLAQQDARLCASVADLGFFSSEALAGAALDEYGAALVAAARSGSGSGRPASPATKQDVLAWLAAVEKIEPAVPVRAMLGDPALRSRSTPEQLCRGAAAMHEAVAALPPAQAERVARTLVGSVIGSAGR